MKSVTGMVLVLLLSLPLLAFEQGMYIIASTYSSKKGAQEELLRLEKAMKRDYQINTLQEEQGFAYALLEVGKFTRIVIEPFQDAATFERVLRSVVKYYPDAYIGMHQTASKSTAPAKPSASKVNKVVTKDEVRMRVDKYLQETMPLVPYVPETVTKKHMDQLADKSTKMVSSVIDARQSSASSSRRSADPDMTLLLLIGSTLFLGLTLFFWMRDKKKQKKRVSLEDYNSRDIPDIPQYDKQ